MNAQIDDYDMDYIILDMGSDVNILMLQTWESMGKMHWGQSHIQLCLANQAKALPIGRLSNVIVDVEGLHKYADFEVINIVDDTNPYPALLGIDWDIDNQTIITFKKMILCFEDEETRVISPIDPFEGKRYVEPIYNQGKVDYLNQIYNVTAMHGYHISPMVDGT